MQGAAAPPLRYGLPSDTVVTLVRGRLIGLLFAVI